jgi:hypothetical protein
MEGVVIAAKRVEARIVAAGRRILELAEPVEVHERRSRQVGDWRYSTAEEEKSRRGALRWRWTITRQQA